MTLIQLFISLECQDPTILNALQSRIFSCPEATSNSIKKTEMRIKRRKEYSFERSSTESVRAPLFTEYASHSTLKDIRFILLHRMTQKQIRRRSALTGAHLFPQLQCF